MAGKKFKGKIKILGIIITLKTLKDPSYFSLSKSGWRKVSKRMWKRTQNFTTLERR